MLIPYNPIVDPQILIMSYPCFLKNHSVSMLVSPKKYGFRGKKPSPAPSDAEGQEASCLRVAHLGLFFFAHSIAEIDNKEIGHLGSR